jgi:hypothetical protein
LPLKIKEERNKEGGGMDDKIHKSSVHENPLTMLNARDTREMKVMN